VWISGAHPNLHGDAAEIRMERAGTDGVEVRVTLPYDTYALGAFEAGALDYLLKPFDDARFHRALCRAKDKLAHRAAIARSS
jgi:DNA-binding LytR/AlgR family response regulator